MPPVSQFLHSLLCPLLCQQAGAFYPLCPTQRFLSGPRPPMDFSSTNHLDFQSNVCVPYKNPATPPHPGSLSFVCRACPVPSCAALHKDSWIVWFDAMLKWLMLAVSSWTTSPTGTNCVSSTHWLSMHTPSSFRYSVTPTIPPGYVITLDFQSHPWVDFSPFCFMSWDHKSVLVHLHHQVSV